MVFNIPYAEFCLKNVFFEKFYGAKKDRKRSRVRVTIEGQRVLLLISLQVKMFDFLLNSQNHRMNHIFPGILLNP